MLSTDYDLALQRTQRQEVTDQNTVLLKPDATTTDILRSVLPRTLDARCGPRAAVLEDGEFEQCTSSQENVAASIAADNLMWRAWEISARTEFCLKSEVYDEMDAIGSSVKTILFETLRIDEARFYNCIRDIANHGSFTPFFESFTESLETNMGEKRRKMCKVSAGIFEGRRSVNVGDGVTLEVYDSQLVKELIRYLQIICNHFLQNRLVSIRSLSVFLSGPESPKHFSVLPNHYSVLPKHCSDPPKHYSVLPKHDQTLL